MSASIWDLEAAEQELLAYELTLENEPEDREDMEVEELMERQLYGPLYGRLLAIARRRGEDFDDVRVQSGTISATKLA